MAKKKLKKLLKAALIGGAGLLAAKALGGKKGLKGADVEGARGLNLRGKIFDTKLKVGYYSKNINNEPASNIAIGLPEVGLSIKSTINIEKEDKKARYGRTSISFPNNKFYFDYKLKENIVSISSSSLINNYLSIFFLEMFIIFSGIEINIKLFSSNL